jgi:hypothetical protein
MTRRRAMQPPLSLALVAGSWVLSCNAVLGIEEFRDRDELRGDGGSADMGEGSGGGTRPSRGGMGEPAKGGTSGANGTAGGRDEGGTAGAIHDPVGGSSEPVGQPGGQNGEPEPGGGTAGEGGAASSTGGSSGAQGGDTSGLGTGGFNSTGGGPPAAGNGGGGSVVSCDMPWSVGNDGYVRAKGAGTTCWHGYAFASASPKATSSADPTSFGLCGANCMLCFKGSVGATVEDLALIGFNLNQSPGSTATANVTPTGTGLTISFTKTGTFPLRVQIQPKAATAGTRWCYTIPETAASPVTIPYAMFNTECWEGGAGKAYGKEDIESMMLLIPGNAVAATPFEACLTGVSEN